MLAATAIAFQVRSRKSRLFLARLLLGGLLASTEGSRTKEFLHAGCWCTHHRPGALSPRKLGCRVRTISKAHASSHTRPRVGVFKILMKNLLLKTYVHTKLCTRMFLAALFITSKTYQGVCPSIGEWIDNCGTTRQWNIIQH